MNRRDAAGRSRDSRSAVAQCVGRGRALVDGPQAAARRPRRRKRTRAYLVASPLGPAARTSMPCYARARTHTHMQQRVWRPADARPLGRIGDAMRAPQPSPPIAHTLPRASPSRTTYPQRPQPQRRARASGRARGGPSVAGPSPLRRRAPLARRSNAIIARHSRRCADRRLALAIAARRPGTFARLLPPPPSQPPLPLPARSPHVAP